MKNILVNAKERRVPVRFKADPPSSGVFLCSISHITKALYILIKIVRAHMLNVKGFTNNHCPWYDVTGTIITSPVSVYGCVNSAYLYRLETIDTSPTIKSNFCQNK